MAQRVISVSSVSGVYRSGYDQKNIISMAIQGSDKEYSTLQIEEPAARDLLYKLKQKLEPRRAG